jgi:EmrB/QacA subfamily drug resistance transporter
MRAPLISDENRKWWTLAAVSVGLFMILLDNTIVNVSLPTIQRELNAGPSELEWIVVSYALTFATLMLTGGKLADYYGRRKLFVIGLVIFSGASLACGLAPNAGFLIAARVAQGVGAAIMNPTTLGIVTATFPPRQRGTAIGIWAGTAGAGLAIGPLLGGVITEKLNWSWIFFVNVPVGAFAIALALYVIDETRDTSEDQRLDIPGLLTSAIGLFSVTYALIEANSYGWTSPRIITLFVVGAIALGIFVMLELRQRKPMLDLALFRNRTFSGANAAMLFVGVSMFGMFFYNSQFFQIVVGYSPIQAGALFLPMTLLIAIASPQTGRLADRVGPRWLIGLGMTLLAVTLILFAQLTADATFWNILPALIVGGFGMACTMTPITAAAMSATPIDKASVGSAVINSARQLGGSLGIAIMGAVVAAQLAPGARPGSPRYVQGFAVGYQHAVYMAAGIMIAGAVLAVTTVRRVHVREPAAAEALLET